jgi:O-methyltransferase involved in polyketide biosynthesis
VDEERPSHTAEGVAKQRALHQTLDAEPKILNDPIAVQLVDPSSAELSGLSYLKARWKTTRVL